MGNEREIVVGGLYRHFKGIEYRVIREAVHTETDEEYVVYEMANPPYNIIYTYMRPKDMFLSEVDKEKYPDATQKYRFELIKDNKQMLRAGEPTLNTDEKCVCGDSKEHNKMEEVFITWGDMEECVGKMLWDNVENEWQMLIGYNNLAGEKEVYFFKRNYWEPWEEGRYNIERIKKREEDTDILKWEDLPHYTFDWIYNSEKDCLEFLLDYSEFGGKKQILINDTVEEWEEGKYKKI